MQDRCPVISLLCSLKKVADWFRPKKIIMYEFVHADPLRKLVMELNFIQIAALQVYFKGSPAQTFSWEVVEIVISSHRE